MPNHQQVILPPGVIIVAAADTDAALAGAATLTHSGISAAGLVAASPDANHDDLAAEVANGLRKQPHVVLVATDPTTHLVGAVAAAARQLGKAATVITVGNAAVRTQPMPEGVDRAIAIERVSEFIPYNHGVDLRAYLGDFAVVGDVHGCQRTLTERLLPALGWSTKAGAPLLVSVGDVHDKGTSSVQSLRWWLAAMRRGVAVMTDSNHARALVRALLRPDLPVRDCVADTVAQIDASVDAAQLRADILATFGHLPTHLVLPGVVAVHAALTEHRMFRDDAENRRFAIHTRFHLTPWHWTGSATLVHGHDTVEQVTVRRASVSPLRPGHVPGPVVNVDTGAYAGGGLSAYRSWTEDSVTVPTFPEEITSTLAQEVSPQAAA